MLSVTHILIADIVRNKLMKTVKIKLNKNSFRYGSIKPDLSTKMRNIQHSKEGSFNFVINEVNSLINETKFESQLRSREFAKRLGIIIHYISDYFCFAHNDSNLLNSFLPHLLYEQKLATICTRSLLKRTEKDIILNPYSLNLNIIDIINYINYMHKMYQYQKPDIILDITYALQTCYTISLYIIVVCIRKCIAQVA